MGKIKLFVQSELAALVKSRHAFHAIPEPSYGERMTADRVMAELTLLGVPFVRYGQTAIVATIGDPSGSTIGARFNMDGLQGCVDGTLGHGTSTIEKHAHACGHDVELAWAMSIARYFATHKPRHTVRLVFQPAE